MVSAVQFCAEITDIKLIHNVLKAISFKEFAVIRPMEEGLKITVEDMKCAETSAYIPAVVFSSYHIDPEADVKFKVSLKVLTECLHIYGEEGTPSVKLSYKAVGSPLCLVSIKHSEENITVDCQINTLDVDEFKEITLADECNVNNVVMNGEPFFEIISVLDMTSDDFEVQITPDAPYFRIITTGIMGESVVDISKQSDTVAVFQCKSSFKSKYAFSNIKQLLKVLSYASKVSISSGETGLLGMQLSIKSDDRQLFVEYYVTALFDED